MIAIVAALVGVLLWQTPAPAPQPVDATAKARDALAAIAAGDFAKVEAQFTEQMKAALPPGRLATLWQGLAQKAGRYKTCSAEPRVRDIADKRMVITACQFEGATVDVQFAFDSAGRISGLALRPAATPDDPYTLPAYANPSAFIEREVTVGSGDWVLPATLTLPAAPQRAPGVVLVHGSGPADRDETVGANKPFRDLAVGLASRGIAVLRYDKRSKVYGAKLAALENATVRQEVVDDAIEAVNVLRGTAGIDPARVFVLGHSLGGMLVPRIAAAGATVSGFIVLAGPARPIEDAMLAQGRHIALADGTISAEEQQQLDQASTIVASVKALKPENAAGGRLIAGAPASYWLDLRGYDPPSEARRVTAPMLILQGERDFQVTMEDFARWKTALGSRADVTFRSYPGLNHLFITGTTASLPSEYLVPGHVAEEVIRDIAAWIQK